MSRAGYWEEVPTDRYLDMRSRNWALAEELGDVVFVSERGVVLVHRERAEHIARMLVVGGRGVLVLEDALALLARPGLGTRWRDALGWIGIGAGAALFAAALAVPLDDPALLLASAIVVRGGRLILDVDS